MSTQQSRKALKRSWLDSDDEEIQEVFPETALDMDADTQELMITQHQRDDLGVEADRRASPEPTRRLTSPGSTRRPLSPHRTSPSRRHLSPRRTSPSRRHLSPHRTSPSRRPLSPRRQSPGPSRRTSSPARYSTWYDPPRRPSSPAISRRPTSPALSRPPKNNEPARILKNWSLNITSFILRALLGQMASMPCGDSDTLPQALTSSSLKVGRDLTSLAMNWIRFLITNWVPQLASHTNALMTRTTMQPLWSAFENHPSSNIELFDLPDLMEEVFFDWLTQSLQDARLESSSSQPMSLAPAAGAATATTLSISGAASNLSVVDRLMSTTNASSVGQGAITSFVRLLTGDNITTFELPVVNSTDVLKAELYPSREVAQLQPKDWWTKATFRAIVPVGLSPEERTQLAKVVEGSEALMRGVIEHPDAKRSSRAKRNNYNN